MSEPRPLAPELKREDLAAAVDQHILSADQLEPLFLFLTGRSATLPPAGEEELRFIRNFHDIFIATGIAIFAIGLSIGVGAITGARFEALDSVDSWNDASSTMRGLLWLTGGLLAGCAALMWGLGEYFARQKRLFFPAIVICLAFALFTFSGGLMVYGALVGEQVHRLELLGDDGGSLEWSARLAPLIIALITATALGGFYTRFKLPFSMGLLGVTAVLAVIALLFAIAPKLIVAIGAPLVFLSGLSLFIMGMAFDVRDPDRVTRFSDNGFWLHLAAAPVLLFGTQLLIFGFDDYGHRFSVGGSILILVVLGLFALISLLINRRALIVSGMLTAGIAIWILLDNAGLGAAGLAAATLLSLGAIVLLLGAGWHSVRRALLGWVPREGLLARIFPPEEAQHAS